MGVSPLVEVIIWGSLRVGRGQRTEDSSWSLCLEGNLGPCRPSSTPTLGASEMKPCARLGVETSSAFSAGNFFSPGGQVYG